MLDAAMARHYAASSNEEFYTGGGPAVFHNFDEIEDHETPTVTEAFERSINLAFIRLMRDLTRYYIAKAVTSKEMLDPKNAARTEYLARLPTPRVGNTSTTSTPIITGSAQTERSRCSLVGRDRPQIDWR